MEKSRYGTPIKIIVSIAFLIMVIINGLGNLLPLNDMSTGQISDAYPNLFAPAGVTFAIWSVIYSLLACYTLYQFGLFQKKNSESDPKLMNSVAGYFIVSSLANAAWIFAWHFQNIILSMMLMTVILKCLISINNEIKKYQLTNKEKFFIRLPFSIYFGWITIATIANAIVLMVSLGWNGFGISESTWAIIIITVGMLIGGTRMLKDKDIAYGLVLIWAYLGIFFKHVSASGFHGQYPLIIAVVLVCIVIFIVGEVYIVESGQKLAE